MMEVPVEKVAAIEKHFHQLLRDIARDLKSSVQPDMPELTGDEVQLNPRHHVSISGMFGGCSYRFVIDESGCYLKVVASSRMDPTFKRVWHVSETGYIKQ